jgi:oligopeptide transport system substrate-binding protein
MWNRNKSLVLLLALAGCVALAGPLSAQDENAGPSFVIGLSEQDLTFNPLHAHTSTDVEILTALYEGLVSYQPLTLETLPAVAESWDISDDKTVYTFHLRENAKYSNGDPITAAQFRDTLLQALNPKEGAEYSVYLDVIKGAAAFRQGKTTDPATVGIRAPSDKVLEITLEKPASHFLKVLCLCNFVPLHPSLKNAADWDQKTGFITNGAFVVSKRDKDEILLTKNKYYWDADEVKIDSIRLRIAEDPKVMTQEVNAGKINWTTLQACDYTLLDAQAREKIVPNSMFATSFLFFVCGSKPFNDPAVRRGLALLLPWKEIRSRQYSLYPSEQLIPEIPKYPAVKGIADQNVAEGLALLEKAGYPKGQGLPPLSILVSKGNTLFADMIAKAWKENLQTEVKFKEIDAKDFFTEIGRHDFTLSSYSWIADFADPLAFLQMWTSGSKLNEALYNNPAYDALLADSLAATGLERYNLLAKAEELLLQEAVVMPIDHIAAFNLIDADSIAGWYPNPLDIHPLKYIEIKKEKLNKWVVRLDSAKAKSSPAGPAQAVATPKAGVLPN